MEPIEKVQARAAALKSLGVGPQATPEEIRTAWRRLAFTSHPDRKGGDLDSFVVARSAYEYLCGGMDEDGYLAGVEAQAHDAVPGTQKPKARPRAAGRVQTFPEEMIAACADLLSETSRDNERGEETPDHVVFLGVRKPSSAEVVHDHIAHSVIRKGRELTFQVPGELSPGLNRVALPTSLLDDPRKTRLRVVAFHFEESGSYRMEIPEDVIADVAPGARMTSIDFVGE